MNEFDVEGCFLIYFQFTSKILAQCVEKTNSNAIGLNVTTKQGINISICKVRRTQFRQKRRRNSDLNLNCFVEFLIDRHNESD